MINLVDFFFYYVMREQCDFIAPMQFGCFAVTYNDNNSKLGMVCIASPSRMISAKWQKDFRKTS